VAGAVVRDYLSWSESQIVVVVPSAATLGSKQEVYLITDGGFAKTTLDLSATTCGEPANVTLAPKVTAVEPVLTCAGGRLVLRGRDFGAARAEVNGKVVIAGAEVRDYLLWQDTEVQVLVPGGVVVGPARELYLITNGGFAKLSIAIVASGC
jgi:hypothetical protein